VKINLKYRNAGRPSYGYWIDGLRPNEILHPANQLNTALITGACLTRIDLVLAASVVEEAHFLRQVPKRIIRLLQAESGHNDGISFPFLSAGLLTVTTSGTGFLDVIF
jgi:NhaP-type Na+/H+ or K+/H+ antiporter